MNEELFPITWEENYLLNVFMETISTRNLSLDYHMRVGEELMKAVMKGFGDTEKLVDGTNEYEVAVKMKRNVYQFSAAKQYQQVREMSDFINDKGVKSTFKEFKEKANVVFEQYNKNYLKTEYNTAVGQGQNAKDWIKAVDQKAVFPVLEYRTQRDSRVRDEHAALDGIKRPVNDLFWNTYMPKNGWNCRCFTVQHEETEVTDLTKRDLSDLDDEKKFPPAFRMNPGKDGIIFNPKKHPYFEVAKGDTTLKKNNFNLPR